MTVDELKAELAAIMNLDASQITEKSNQENTPEWDSMASLQIISFLDEAGDEEIEADQADKLNSFEAVAKLARERGLLTD